MPRQNAVAPIPIRPSPSTKAAAQLQHTFGRLQKQLTKTRNEVCAVYAVWQGFSI